MFYHHLSFSSVMGLEYCQQMKTKENPLKKTRRQEDIYSWMQSLIFIQNECTVHISVQGDIKGKRYVDHLKTNNTSSVCLHLILDCISIA